MRLGLFFLLTLATACASLYAQDAAPLQQWIDEAIKAGGGVVTVPEGVHRLDKGLVIANAHKLALRGVNKEACVIELQGDAESLLSVIGSGKTLEIANLTLIGKATVRHLIHIQSTQPTSPSSDITVRDCLFQNFHGPAIHLQNTKGSSIERCSFRDGDEAIVTTHSENSTVRGNKIIRVNRAINLLSSPQSLIEGNEVWECKQALITSPADKSIIIRNNSFAEANEVNGKP